MLRHRTPAELSAAHTRLRRGMPPIIYRVWGAAMSRFLAPPRRVLVPVDCTTLYNVLSSPKREKYFDQFSEIVQGEPHLEDDLLDAFLFYLSEQLSVDPHEDNVRALGRDRGPTMGPVGKNDESEGQSVGPIASEEVEMAPVPEEAGETLTFPRRPIFSPSSCVSVLSERFHEAADLVEVFSPPHAGTSPPGPGEGICDQEDFYEPPPADFISEGSLTPVDLAAHDNRNSIRSPGAVHTGLHPTMFAYKTDSPLSCESPSSSQTGDPFFNKRNSLEPMSDYLLTLEGEVPHTVSLPGRYPARVAGHPTTDPAFHLDTAESRIRYNGTRDGAEDPTQNPAPRAEMTTRAANSRPPGGRLDDVGNTHLGSQDHGKGKHEVELSTHGNLGDELGHSGP